MEIKEFFIEVDGAKLFCRTAGEGDPLIVLHGGPGLSQDCLLPQMMQLAKNHFVIFYDQRASGQSEGALDPESINLDRFVEDLGSVLKRLSIVGCKR